VAVPFYDDGTSGSPLRLRDLFQEFLNLMDLAQRWRGETTRRLRLPFVGRDLILDFPDEACWLVGEGPVAFACPGRPREDGSNSSVNFDAGSQRLAAMSFSAFHNL
jgi:hypothetical protein